MLLLFSSDGVDEELYIVYIDYRVLHPHHVKKSFKLYHIIF